MTKMRLAVFKELEVRLPQKKLRSLFELVTDDEADPGQQGSVHFIFCPDSTVKKLNAKFRDRDQRTDVLSFNLDDESNKDSVFGEIYIAVPTAIRQARQYGASLSEEIVRLSCHGLLHLFGYDHIKESDAVRMKALEEKYLTAVLGRVGATVDGAHT